MSYADLLNQTRQQNKNSTDRLISPPRRRHRSSLTPTIKTSTKFTTPQFSDSPIPCHTSLRLRKQLLVIPPQESLRFTDSSSNSPVASRTSRVFGKPSHRIELSDIHSDFYLSPMDWSKRETIAVACTASTVFVNAKTGHFMSPPGTLEMPTSVRFSGDGEALFIGSHDGHAMLYSPVKQSPVTTTCLFDEDVLCADWHENTIIAGGRNGEVVVIDPREWKPAVYKSETEQICCVKFNRDGSRYATGGNDTRVRIWDVRNFKQPYLVYDEHVAAVRAIEWSPCAHNMILTGGGSTDRTIRLWNVETCCTVNWVNTGSQVCNLHWNEEHNEILSTHGFSQNHLALWKAADLSPVAQFFEHKERVLFMAVSPDHSRIASAAPDDGLLIWKMFPSKSLSLDQVVLAIR